MDFSVLEQVHDFKDCLVKFTRSLRGNTSEPGPGARSSRDDDDQGVEGIFNQTGTLLGRRLWPQRPRASTPSTLANQTGSNGQSDTPGETALEMTVVNRPENAV